MVAPPSCDAKLVSLARIHAEKSKAPSPGKTGRVERLSSAKPSPQRPSEMTSQGTAHGRFHRAIHRRHVQAAEMAAREMGGLSLADALSLCELLANTDPARYERAALRWLQRFIDERLPPLTEVAEIARWCETGKVAYERDFEMRLTLKDDRVVRIVVMPGDVSQ